MLLYENNGKKIDVYTFTPNETALTQYRKEEIEKIDLDDLFYCFETTNNTIKERFLATDELDIRFTEHKENSTPEEDWWAEITHQKSVARSQRLNQKEILDKYINGAFSKVLPTITFIPDEGVDCYLDNYLVTGEATSISSNLEKKTIYRIENIIKLPKNLCTLQLLLNGEFAKILSTWFDYVELLRFFNVVKETEINQDQLKKITHFGLVNETYDQIQRKIDTTAIILQHIKKN